MTYKTLGSLGKEVLRFIKFSLNENFRPITTNSFFVQIFLSLGYPLLGYPLLGHPLSHDNSFLIVQLPYSLSKLIMIKF